MRGDEHGGRALVLGGSLAGLLAAGALAGHHDEVVVVERDRLTDGPGARRGVPHGRHSHGLLVGGSRAIERLLPGITAEFLTAGAVLGDLTHRGRWTMSGIEQRRWASGLDGLLASRPLVETAVRRRVLALPNVTLLDGHDIVGLTTTPDRRRVTGARIAPAGPELAGPERGGDEQEGVVPDQWGAGEREVTAGLVVDATGRGSRAGRWLVDLGYPQVREQVVEAGITYVTRRFRDRPGVLADLDADVVGADPRGSRSGVALRQEEGTWTVTLAGSFGERPPTELGAFREWALTLPTKGLAEVATLAEPMGDARTYRYPASRWLRWDRLPSGPAGFLVIGDAVCSFNPVYGQGMSSAAQQAEALADLLAAGRFTPERAAKRFAAVIAVPWTLATGADRRHPSQPRKPLPERVLDRYLDRLLALAPDDEVVALAFFRVLNLLAGPAELLRPGVVARVLLGGSRRVTSPDMAVRNSGARGYVVPSDN